MRQAVHGFLLTSSVQLNPPSFYNSPILSSVNKLIIAPYFSKTVQLYFRRTPSSIGGMKQEWKLRKSACLIQSTSEVQMTHQFNVLGPTSGSHDQTKRQRHEWQRTWRRSAAFQQPSKAVTSKPCLGKMKTSAGYRGAGLWHHMMHHLCLNRHGLYPNTALLHQFQCYLCCDCVTGEDKP